MKKTLLIATLVICSFAATAQAQKNTSQSYIEQFKDNAISIMRETGIPASIILGIAMHESGNGNSSVAKNLNNQFGFKGNGGSVYYKNNKKVRSSYKKYDSILESFTDFARVITQRRDRGAISAELTETQYEKWVKGIQRSGYASSKKWSAQVLAIIRKYELNALDKESAKTAAAPQQLAQNEAGTTTEKK
ncbi:glucosaminidase domain-containing protein [Mucilaginibacter sp. HD30]